MKILVPVKRVIDAYVRVRVKADHSGVETVNVKMAMNPFDEIALEEALRIKEQQSLPVTEIVIVSIGNDACQETLRSGLALGADRALLLKTDRLLSPIDVARQLHQVVVQEQPQLVLMGKQAIDSDDNQTGQMLAALLDWPQATFASKVTFPASTTVEVTREIDGGLEVLALQLPAVVTTDLRLNVPRYASLPNIMKSKSKPLQVTVLDDSLWTDPAPIELLAVTPPAARQAGVMLNTVDELVAILKQAEGVR